MSDTQSGDGQTSSTVGCDKRLLIVEPEFARLLGVAGRHGSTVSPIVREMWDSGDLRIMTKREPLVATGAHISLIGHITEEELQRCLTTVETANGFGNRLLFVYVDRSKLLPLGAEMPPDAFDVLTARISESLNQAQRFGRMYRSVQADELWQNLYAEMAAYDRSGVIGALTARAEAQVLRLSLLYALCDGCAQIEPVHLRAAHALWLYSVRSVEHIFHRADSDQVTEVLLEGLLTAPDGLDLTQQNQLFSGHVSAERLRASRQQLEQEGKTETTSVPTQGRARMVTRVVSEK